MKMDFIFSGMVWGAFFILLGVSIIFKILFHWDIPVFRTFFALFLIFLGVKIIVGGFHRGLPRQDAPPPPASVSTDPGKKTDVVFGKGTMDLTDLVLKDQDIVVESNTVFGETIIKIKADTPALVRTSSAFGEARLPDGSSSALGTYIYKTKAYQEGKPRLIVNANVVFGAMEVVEETSRK
jgi:predicted membrane protein